MHQFALDFERMTSRELSGYEVVAAQTSSRSLILVVFSG